MNEIRQQSTMALRFVRRNLGRIVVGTTLFAIVYVSMAVAVQYQREKRIARRVEAVGGHVDWKFMEPDWVPQEIRDTLRDRTIVFTHIYSINLDALSVSSDLLSEIGALSCLKYLWLSNTQVNDVGMERLKRLTNLGGLSLDGTQVTDAGLAHLKGMSKLHWVRFA